MLNLEKIARPATVSEALRLLQQPRAAALAGGTALVAGKRRDIELLVDLGALGLDYVRESAGSVALGAMTPLAALAESPLLRALARGVVAQAAQKSASSVLRNQATLGGTILSEPDGILALALLALDARLVLLPDPPGTLPFGGTEGWLARRSEWVGRGILLTEITLPLSNPSAALHTVARTPSDKPIVAACASAQVEKGTARQVRLALCGVGETVHRALQAEQMLEGQLLTEALIASAARAAAQGLAPRGDFRGSAAYRIEMAVVLARRALAGLTG